MSKHRRETHPEYVEGCFGCKISTVGVGAVPGGTRPGSYAKDHAIQFKKDMDAYAGARKAGIQPERTSAAAVEAEEKRLEKHTKTLETLDRVGVDTRPLKGAVEKR